MKNKQVSDTAISERRKRAFLAGLRVRIKELAQEARFIRLEEHREKEAADGYKNTRNYRELNWHRRFHVRPAARAAQLAYAFLRGVPYKVIEPKSYSDDWSMDKIKKEVKRLADKFGRLPYGQSYDEDVDKWFNE